MNLKDVKEPVVVHFKGMFLKTE